MEQTCPLFCKTRIKSLRIPAGSEGVTIIFYCIAASWWNDHYIQVSLYSSQLVGSRGVTIIHRFHCIAASWLGPEGWQLYTGFTV